MISLETYLICFVSDPFEEDNSKRVIFTWISKRYQCKNIRRKHWSKLRFCCIKIFIPSELINSMRSKYFINNVRISFLFVCLFPKHWMTFFFKILWFLRIVATNIYLQDLLVPIIFVYLYVLVFWACDPFLRE